MHGQWDALFRALEPWAATSAPRPITDAIVAARLDQLLRTSPQLHGVSGQRVLIGPERDAPSRPMVPSGPMQSRNGRCQLLRSADGWVALQLANDDDLGLVPALVGPDIFPSVVAASADSGGWAQIWVDIAAWARLQPGESFVEQCRSLGLAASRLGEITTARAAVTAHRIDRTPTEPPPRHRPGERGVVSAASLWAGPLAARLLGLALGTSVTRAESGHRRDPMAARDDALSRWLHTGHEVYRFDHRDPHSRADLAARAADSSVMITSGRARSLRSLGLNPWARSAGPTVWIHISGYGITPRRAMIDPSYGDAAGPPGAEAVDDLRYAADAAGFGDDAAVAGGLVGVDDAGRPSFIADAVGDPVTGVVAAITALGALSASRIDPRSRWVLDVSLASCAAWLMGSDRSGTDPIVLAE